MGLNPSFLLLFDEPRTDEVLRAVLHLGTAPARARLQPHLPWHAARVERCASGPLGLGIRGWHGWAADTANYHSYHLRIVDDELPCDLSICAGARLGMIELCAATDAAAVGFFAPRVQRRVAEHLAPVSRAIFFDDESGSAWRPLVPDGAAWRLYWNHRDLASYQLPQLGDDLALDIDAFGDLVLELLAAP